MSVIYLPLTVEKKKIGIVTVQSNKPNAYSSQHYEILQTLASYIAIAFDNANIYKALEKNNEQLKEQTSIINETNTQLEERQQQIEEQAEELSVQAENLKQANGLLSDNQQIIKKQAEKLLEKNEQLTVLNATKDRFFSIIAHDLRNPFHLLIGFSELLLKNFEKYSADKNRKYLQMILESSQSGHSLLENLLQWSRTQTGHISFEPTRIKLNEIILETFLLHSGMAEQKNILLESSVNDNTFIFADENMVKTIIRNLISNAIKFTPDNGQINIKALEQQSMIEITVSDTGVGISEENLKKLFRLDTPVSTMGTQKEKGTGLGLLLCKEFVEKHGGKIRVESTEGKGSDFIFTLPAH
jgi:signal transduction histidine kinase